MTLQETLRNMVDAGRVPHAIMLHEDDGGGGLGVALDFLAYLYKDENKVSKLIHPDIHFIYPIVSGKLSESYLGEWRSLVTSNPRFTENDVNTAFGVEGKLTQIGVPEAKSLLDMLNLSALEGGYRTAVIYLPEKMNAAASNKLLKEIEEPAPLTQFVLITHDPDKVLTTIRSRCQQFRVMPLREKVRGPVFGQFSDLMSALERNDLIAALEVGDSLAALPSRENAKAFCKFASDTLRNIFMIQQGMTSLADGGEDAAGWAGTMPKTFPRAAAADLDRACSLIDRNVNSKILFTDLVDRLYLHFQK